MEITTMSFLKSIFQSKKKSTNDGNFPHIPEELLGGIVGVFSCPNKCEDRGFVLWMRSDVPVCDKCGARLDMVLSPQDIEKLAKSQK
jgi:hypothetical protein